MAETCKSPQKRQALELSFFVCDDGSAGLRRVFLHHSGGPRWSPGIRRMKPNNGDGELAGALGDDTGKLGDHVELDKSKQTGGQEEGRRNSW